MKDLLSFYESFLKTLNLSVDAEGLLSLTMADDTIPATCDGRRMVLPTNDVLRKADWGNVIAFHPVCESIVRKESVMLRRTRSLIVLMLTYRITVVGKEILTLAADTASHSTLSPKQLEVLKVIPDVDAKTLEAFDKLVSKTGPTSTQRIINVYLKTGAQINNTSYRRAGVVSFPILEEFDKPEHSIFDVEMRKKDKATIGALLRWILTPTGEIEIPNYSAGSNSDIAPYFDALARAYHKVSTRLNAISHLFRKHLSDYNNLHVDLSWIESLNDMSAFKGVIPTLAGNTGEVEGETKEHVAVAPISYPPPQAAPYQHPPQPNQPPYQPQPYPQPQAYQQPYQPPVNPQQYGNPGYQPPPPPAEPVPLRRIGAPMGNTTATSTTNGLPQLPQVDAVAEWGAVQRRSEQASHYQQPQQQPYYPPMYQQPQYPQQPYPQAGQAYQPPYQQQYPQQQQIPQQWQQPYQPPLQQPYQQPYQPLYQAPQGYRGI